MKRVPGAVIVLICLILLAFLNYSMINRIEKKISAGIEQSVVAIRADDYSGANTSLQQAQTVFKNSEGYLGAVVRHSELDDAFLSFARLFALIEIKDKNSYIEECAVLKELFENIGNMESLSIRNVL